MAKASVVVPPKQYNLVLELSEKEATELEALTKNPLPGSNPVLKHLFEVIFKAINSNT